MWLMARKKKVQSPHLRSLLIEQALEAKPPTIQEPNPENPNEPLERLIWEVNPGIAEKAAKELYFQFIHPNEIHRLTGVPKDVLRVWIYDLEWKNERDELIESDLDRVKSTLKTYSQRLTQVCRDSIDILADNIRYIKHNEEKLNLAELKTLSSILSDIDTLSRLETGRPTSILMSSVNQGEVLQLLKDIQSVDPYCDYIEIEASESEDSPEVIKRDREEPKLLEGLPPQVRSLKQELETPQLPNKSSKGDF